MTQERSPQRVKMVACDVLARECHAVVARARRTVNLELLQQGLHDLGSEGMLARPPSPRQVRAPAALAKRAV